MVLGTYCHILGPTVIFWRLLSSSGAYCHILGLLPYSGAYCHISGLLSYFGAYCHILDLLSYSGAYCHIKWTYCHILGLLSYSGANCRLLGPTVILNGPTWAYCHIQWTYWGLLSYSMGIEAFYQRVKRPGRQTVHSTPSTARFKKGQTLQLYSP
jgi:hypothetical protein